MMVLSITTALSPVHLDSSFVHKTERAGKIYLLSPVHCDNNFAFSGTGSQMQSAGAGAKLGPVQCKEAGAGEARQK